MPVIEADDLAHQVLREEEVKAEIRRIFGQKFFQDDEVDRRKLGELVFRDAEARERLERIVHPRSRQRLAEAERLALEVFGVVMSVIPLLFEKRMVGGYDAVWLAYASEETCLRRAMERDGLSEEEVRRRMSAQWPLEEKKRRADLVISTEVPLPELKREVWKSVREWLGLS